MLLQGFNDQAVSPISVAVLCNKKSVKLYELADRIAHIWAEAERLILFEAEQKVV